MGGDANGPARGAKTPTRSSILSKDEPADGYVYRSQGVERSGMSDDVSDSELVDAIRSGETEALGTLYDRHAARLLPAALGILRNRRDAEDLIHDVFVEAWQNAHSYDASRGTVYGWLAIRLRSRAIDRLRSLQKAAKYLQAVHDEQQGDAVVRDKASLGADCERARHALHSLPAKQREVVELGYFRGMTCSEIATRCGIPLGTVKSRLSGALSRLRGQLVSGMETGL